MNANTTPDAITLAHATIDNTHAFKSADAMIADAQARAIWPTNVYKSDRVLVDNGSTTLHAPKATAVIGDYVDGPRVIGLNGRRYNHTTVPQWSELLRAAEATGARPVFADAIDGKTIAQFEVTKANGIGTYLTLGDSPDGSSKLFAAMLSSRFFCMNQLAAQKLDASWARISHTASLEEKIARLTRGIGDVVDAGAKVADMFARASGVHLPAPAAKIAFDALFPPAPEDATPAARTRAENARTAARIAAAMRINRVGGKGNLATLWNAATYLVDRTESGVARPARGDSSRVGSMIFGSRGKRVEEVRHLVEVILADGTVEAMTVNKATEVGVDTAQLGSGLLAAMLEDAGPSN